MADWTTDAVDTLENVVATVRDKTVVPAQKATKAVVSAYRGLGFVILDASSFFRTTYVFAGIILIGIIGLISDRAIAYAARRIVHWEGRR